MFFMYIISIAVLYYWENFEHNSEMRIFTEFLIKVMSSQEQEEVPLGHVLLDEVVDGDFMDESVLDSSDREDGEQGRRADEAMLKEESTPKGTDEILPSPDCLARGLTNLNLDLNQVYDHLPESSSCPRMMITRTVSPCKMHWLTFKADDLVWTLWCI